MRLRPQRRLLASSQADSSGETTTQADRICYVGAGYVGATSGIIMAAMNPESHIDIVDRDAGLIEKWNSHDLPISEPGLEKLLKGNGRLANLRFSTEITRCIASAQVIFLCVNTPLGDQGLDTAALDAAVLTVAEASKGAIVVEKSTVPVTTAQRISDILKSRASPGAQFTVLSNPEFLAQGTAVRDLLEPNRVVIGSLPSATVAVSIETLVKYYSWVPRERILTMSTWSSELSKIASNAMIAQRISSINSLSAICECVNARVDDVSSVLRMEPRIGSKTLQAGFGFGGSCLKKDLLCLVYLAQSLGLNQVAAYWNAVVDMNDYQNSRISMRVLDTLAPSEPKKIAIFGFSFKAGTTDTRGSVAIDLAHDFLKNGAAISIYDPHTPYTNIRQALNLPDDSNSRSSQNVQLGEYPYEVCRDANAIVVHTDWEEFHGKGVGKIDWQQVAKVMKSPRTFLCPFGSMDMLEMERFGFSIVRIGQ